jgi:hypothetical protein
MPISATQNAASGGKRANVSGSPQWLLYAAGDRDKLPGVAMARIATKAVQSGEGVVHQQQMPRIGHIAVHHRARRAFGHRIGDEGMAVAGLAAQSDEQVIWL